MVLKNKKKSQSFSTDIIVVVIIILFGALFMVINKINDTKDSNLEEVYDEASVDSKVIVENLKSTNIIDSENIVDIGRISGINYEELKEELGIKNDFAIVFEKDGKLVKIDSENDVNCIGSSNIVVNGIQCK